MVRLKKIRTNGKYSDKYIDKNLLKEKYGDRRRVKMNVLSFKRTEKGVEKKRRGTYNLTPREINNLLSTFNKQALKTTDRTAKYKIVISDGTTNELIGFADVENAHQIFEDIS